MRLLSIVLGLCTFVACGGRGGPREIDVEKAKEMRIAGDASYKRGMYKEAIDSYTIAIECNPDYAEAYLLRGNAWTLVAEVKDSDANTKEARLQAVADYTASIQKNPVGYDAYFNRGVMACVFKQYLAAVKDFLQCTQIRTIDPEPHFLIGQLYETRFENMGVRALDHYEKYVQLGGTNDEAIERVKQWQAVKKQSQPVTPTKNPTSQEEDRAKELHNQLTALISQGTGKSSEAFKVVDELLTKYGHTKYVRDRISAFTAIQRALKPPEKAPEKK